MTLMGIDLGTRKVSTAVFGQGDLGLSLQAAHTHEVPEQVSRPDQLLELARFVHDQALFYEVGQVWIEDVIIGNNRKYSLQLAQVLGAVMASLATGRLVLDIRRVDNKTWKKEMVGNGNASKDMVRNYIVATYPDYALLCGDDQDRFDACCVGLYGLRISARADQLRLADTPE